MRFLDTNQIGFDANSLGFPSVGTCEAIVYQTDVGLFGFHAASGTMTFQKKAEAFARYVQHRSMDIANQPARGICVMGVIHRGDRHQDTDQGGQDWTNELTTLADALHFNGHVYGARAMSHTDTGGEQQNSIYIRFDWILTEQCKVFYKRWSKFQYDQVTAVAGSTRNRQDLTNDPNQQGEWIYKGTAGNERDVSRFNANGALHSEGDLHRITKFITLR